MSVVSYIYITEHTLVFVNRKYFISGMIIVQKQYLI